MCSSAAADILILQDIFSMSELELLLQEYTVIAPVKNMKMVKYVDFHGDVKNYRCSAALDYII